MIAALAIEGETTMTGPRRRGVHAFDAAALAAALLAGTANAATLTYPGVAPCNTTLQACVTGAGANDTIEIAQNALIAESVDIDKSLTIQPAAGFLPQVQFFFTAVTTTSKNVTVRGMTGGYGVRALLAPGGGNLTVMVEDSTFTAATFSGVTVGDNGAAGTYGTLDATIRNNHIDVPDPGGFGCTSGISVVNTASQVTARVIGNSIVAVNQYQCGGIEGVVGASGGGSILIERNEIRGSDFDWGIVFRHFGANPEDPTYPFDGTIVNNLVVGQNGNTGAPAGIVLSADGYNALLRGTVANNTVASGRIGMIVSARTDLGANIEVTIANNIVALNSDYDIGIDSALSQVSNDHNLVSSNAYGYFVPGPGTRIGNPGFVNVAGGDYHLLADSPAIDAGRDSALDASFTIDLDGAARRFGRIDMGAYESPYRAAPAPVPVGGPASLALVAMLIGWLARRRLAAFR